MSLSDDNDINIEAKIYDTGGSERYRGLNISWINKADCILLVLDASNNYQKEGIIFYYEEILKILESGIWQLSFTKVFSIC